MQYSMEMALHNRGRLFSCARLRLLDDLSDLARYCMVLKCRGEGTYGVEEEEKCCIPW